MYQSHVQCPECKSITIVNLKILTPANTNMIYTQNVTCNECLNQMLVTFRAKEKLMIYFEPEKVN